MRFKGTKIYSFLRFVMCMLSNCWGIQMLHCFRKEWVYLECRVELGWKAWERRRVCEGEKERMGGWRGGKEELDLGSVRKEGSRVLQMRNTRWLLDMSCPEMCWRSGSDGPHVPLEKRDLRTACVTIRFPLPKGNRLCWFGSGESLFLGPGVPQKAAPWTKSGKGSRAACSFICITERRFRAFLSWNTASFFFSFSSFVLYF